MFNHKVTLSYSDDSGTVQAVVYAETGQNEVGFDGTVAAATTGFMIEASVPHTQIQSLMMYSNVAVVVKTNSDTAPAQTINLAAGQMLLWATLSYNANPITADITSIYIDNAGPTAAAVKIRFLMT